MKKLIITLTIVLICLITLNIFSLIDMSVYSINYKNKLNEYNQINLTLKENEETVSTLNNNLETLINQNSNSNKEYKVWKSLIDQVSNLLNK